MTPLPLRRIDPGSVVHPSDDPLVAGSPAAPAPSLRRATDLTTSTWHGASPQALRWMVPVMIVGRQVLLDALKLQHHYGASVALDDR